MLIMGARMRTPATWVSNARSRSLSREPAKCDTSVEVPPMSKPMILPKPAAREARTAPTTPPAGPQRSEEHTSELQSLTNIVCRLLLEKKKKDAVDHQHQPQQPLASTSAAVRPDLDAAHTVV